MVVPGVVDGGLLVVVVAAAAVVVVVVVVGSNVYRRKSVTRRCRTNIDMGCSAVAVDVAVFGCRWGGRSSWRGGQPCRCRAGSHGPFLFLSLSSRSPKLTLSFWWRQCYPAVAVAVGSTARNDRQGQQDQWQRFPMIAGIHCVRRRDGTCRAEVDQTRDKDELGRDETSDQLRRTERLEPNGNL